MTGDMASNVESEAHFAQQRRKAFLADVLAVLTQRPNDLLSYEAARKALRANQQLPATTETIPVGRIVGSVGRYRDFTRAFLPRSGASRERWKRLDGALERLESIPPIEVFQLGDVYFVRDGNHRVSVARANGVKHIEARVTRVASRVPLTADVSDEAEIIKEYAWFLDQTNLDQLRPQQRIYFSAPGHYRILLEHIAVHRYFMGLDWKRQVSHEEAVVDWYDKLYEPIVATVRANHILDDFPGRTEADLSLLIIDHHYYLSERYGAEVSPAQAAEHFAGEFGGPLPVRAVRAVWRQAQNAVRRLVAGLRQGPRARPAGTDGKAGHETGRGGAGPTAGRS